MDKDLLQISKFDAAHYLNSADDIQIYLNEALLENDPAAFLQALNTVARAKGMGKLAKTTGLSRENLYQSLSATGNPEFRTLWKVITALGCNLAIRKNI